MEAKREWPAYAEQYERLGYWEPLTLGRQLALWAEEHADRIALVEGETRLTYRELDRKADELAAGFFQRGLKKGDHVVVQLPNRISFVLTCFALFRLGALPVMALPAHREAELDGIFSLTQPVAYIIPETFLGFDYQNMAERLAKRHSSVQLIILDGENGRSHVRLRDISGPPVDFGSPSHRDIALLLLSGGTTGTPKLIPRTHADYAYNAKACARRCKLGSHSVYLAVLPAAHNFPLCCPGILGTLSAGGRVVLCPTTSCEEAFPLIEKEGVTITALVPALANMWLDVLEWDTSSDISSLEVLQVGGAMLDANIARRITREMGCKLQQVFGIAEGLICCTSLDDDEETILGCQGRPLAADDEIRIVDHNGQPAVPGEYGELLVRGPYTIRGYYRAPEQNSKCFTADGFYCSGDKARITPEGNIQIGGRIKEQINRAGEKIMPAEIEAHLLTHPDIRDAAVVGLADENLGERSCAFLMTEDEALTLSAIHQYLRDRGVARYKLPDQMERVEYWPLTSVGKIDKMKLKQMAENKAQPGEVKPIAYREERVHYGGNIYLAAAQIAEALDEPYLLYETGQELSVGLGVHALLTVEPEYTTLTMNNKVVKLNNQDLSNTIDKALDQVRLRNWRAYGIANFALARHYWQLPLLEEDSCLLKLVIPKVEVRFSKGEVLWRALDEESFRQTGELVTSIADGGRREAEQALLQRLNTQKVETPGVRTHNAGSYQQVVAEAVREIRERKYQKVILSRKIPLGTKLDMVASYIAGRQVNSPARSFLLNLDGLQAAGFSPETVVEVDRDGWVSTQPLAGTRALGDQEEETRRLREELLNDPKEVAEHAVSVKLAFEEMRSICSADTTAVSEFMSVLSRGTVQHIASRLTGKLKPGCNSWHAFQALFPAVTASGIPKKEALEAIGRLEGQARNLYSGCVLIYDSDGALDAALVLRTIFQQDNQAWLHAGAGIVEMSAPSREIEETREKLSSVSRRLVAALQF